MAPTELHTRITGVPPVPAPSESSAPAAAPKTATLLEAQNVHRILGSGDTSTDILKGVNLSVHPGEYVSIVGASGSGKSTLLYLLGGLDRPSRQTAAGQPFTPPSRILIEGQDTATLNDTQLALVRNAKAGFVFQFHYLLKEFTAQENVALPMLKLAKLSKSQIMDRAATLLKRFGLGDKLKRRANRLSGGEQQRVAIARALANEPAVILADEPTGNLDRKNSELVADIFQQLASAGQTLIMVTHDPAFAHRARRIITMEDGNIIADTQTTPAP
ncbi:MAG: transporter [Phycisphaerales bacterium]|nr:transporter [Phycisphaerales bacterium]